MHRSILAAMVIPAVLALAGCGHGRHGYAQAQHGCAMKEPAQPQPAAQQPTQVIVIVPGEPAPPAPR